MLLSVNVGRKGKLRDSLFHPPIPLPPPNAACFIHAFPLLILIRRQNVETADESCHNPHLLLFIYPPNVCLFLTNQFFPFADLGLRRS